MCSTLQNILRSRQLHAGKATRHGPENEWNPVRHLQCESTKAHKYDIIGKTQVKQMRQLPRYTGQQTVTPPPECSLTQSKYEVQVLFKQPVHLLKEFSERPALPLLHHY